MFACRGHHAFTAILEQVVQEQQGLVSASPVGVIIDQHALPQHAHGLGKLLVGEGESRHLLHLLTRGSPRVVIGGIAYLGLGIRVVHHQIGGLVHHLADLPHGNHLARATRLTKFDRPAYNNNNNDCSNSCMYVEKRAQSIESGSTTAAHPPLPTRQEKVKKIYTD